MLFRPALVKAAVELLRSGMPEQKIHSTLGVSASVWYQWCRRGREEKSGKYKKFVERMEKARSEYLEELVKTAKELAVNRNIVTEEKVIVSEDGKKKTISTVTHKPQDSRLLMFMMERSFPEEFREHVKTENVVEGKVPMVLDFGQQVDNSDRLKQLEEGQKEQIIIKVEDAGEPDTARKPNPDESGADSV